MMDAEDGGQYKNSPLDRLDGSWARWARVRDHPDFAAQKEDKRLTTTRDVILSEVRPNCFRNQKAVIIHQKIPFNMVRAPCAVC